MKKQLMSKACKQSLSFLWHPHRLGKKLKMRIATGKVNDMHHLQIYGNTKHNTFKKNISLTKNLK